jgi:ATP-dependent Clp protease ATP-binding subunit ClpA
MSSSVDLPGEPASRLVPRAWRDLPRSRSTVEPPGSIPARIEEHGRRICTLAEEARNAGDPESALRVLTELRHELDAFVRLQVERGLVAGRSFGELARALGISRQAAHRRYRELAPRREPRRLAATEQARYVVRLAHAETCAAGESAVGSRQLLLAVLRTDTDAAHALQSEGVTLEKARACPPPARENGADPACLRRILRRAGRLALARGDRHLGPRQLLVATLADEDGGAAHTLTALGATPASIRARLGC